MENETFVNDVVNDEAPSVPDFIQSLSPHFIRGTAQNTIGIRSSFFHVVRQSALAVTNRRRALSHRFRALGPFIMHMWFLCGVRPHLYPISHFRSRRSLPFALGRTRTRFMAGGSIVPANILSTSATARRRHLLDIRGFRARWHMELMRIRHTIVCTTCMPHLLVDTRILRGSWSIGSACAVLFRPRRGHLLCGQSPGKSIFTQVWRV